MVGEAYKFARKILTQGQGLEGNSVWQKKSGGSAN